MQGDIGYYPFVQFALPGELPPLDPAAPPQKGVPSFDGATDDLVEIGDTQLVARRWFGLGVIIDVTSELLKRPYDTRVTVAALAPRRSANVNWEAAARGELVGVLALPEAPRDSISAGFPEADWPPLVLAGRSVTTISRQMAHDGRLMTLQPQMTGLLAAKLSEMYAERHWARASQLPNVLNQTLVSVDDIGKAGPKPPDGRWVVMSFGNKERLQVLLNPKE